MLAERTAAWPRCFREPAQHIAAALRRLEYDLPPTPEQVLPPACLVDNHVCAGLHALQAIRTEIRRTWHRCPRIWAGMA